ncbi:MAG TPA: NAD(+)/NADH kinase [Actinomycetota bacterium]|jgi:NAD+ kinase|nr:NAD(+)/NADH kinase [Actinomycetota bacterium]
MVDGARTGRGRRVKRVGFVVHPGRPSAARAAESLGAWLRRRGIEVDMMGDGGEGTSPGGRLDLVVSVGGDGTFLHAAHVAARVGCPILGVKVGRVGFLTEVEPEEAPRLLERAMAGSAHVEERLAILAESDEARFEPQWALNEVILEKRARHRLVRLALYVGNVYVTTFSADGVIVSTPTGSTAYSFSAGGPIVTPTIPCLIVTPVAAHMVFDRSLVLSADERVTLEVVGEEDGLLSADGRESLEVPVGASVRIGAAPTPGRLIRREDAPAFHALVREKFGLPGDPGSRARGRSDESVGAGKAADGPDGPDGPAE